MSSRTRLCNIRIGWGIYAILNAIDIKPAIIMPDKERP